MVKNELHSCKISKCTSNNKRVEKLVKKVSKHEPGCVLTYAIMRSLDDEQMAITIFSKEI